MSLNVVTGGLAEGRSPECCVVRVGDSVRRGRNGVLLSGVLMVTLGIIVDGENIMWIENSTMV